MVEVKYCGSIPMFDGVPGERMEMSNGWMYGVHILGSGFGAGPCPVCGLIVGKAMKGNHMDHRRDSLD